MQPKLFTDPSAGKYQKSYGVSQRKKLMDEQNYQKNKRDCQNLQQQWSNSKETRSAEQAKRSEQLNQLKSQPPQIIVLVACVSLKLETASPAKDLYCSPWFIKARKYAEKFGDKWFILSSLHGLLEPEQLIEPYEQTLYTARKPERAAWSARVGNKINSTIPPGSTIIILAGKIYRESLEHLLAQKFKVEIPMAGLGIGKQLQYLENAVN
ncbi:MAG TPA: hypothetical protein PKY82_30510 [Pyrinomonadaceae bacterium]|nr:hypothetical protein [Pyrinomonadaceae bacterium]